MNYSNCFLSVGIFSFIRTSYHFPIACRFKIEREISDENEMLGNGLLNNEKTVNKNAKTEEPLQNSAPFAPSAVKKAGHGRHREDNKPVNSEK